MQKVHIVGVGGIGTSALARYFLSEGKEVSGSDLATSEILEELRHEGVRVAIGHGAANIPPGTELVIFSAAVQKNNPELTFAKRLEIPRASYAEAIGELTRRYATIAVSGSHGKSTTTALLALVLIAGGLDPTVIVGTKLKEFGNKNFRKGGSRYLLLEADEWDKSFHHYIPRIAVTTNIDREHLDTYKTYRGVVAGFACYLENVPKDGSVIVNWSDPALRRIGEKMQKEKRAQVVFYNRTKFQKHSLKIPGAMNQVNAEAAWQAARLLGVKRAVAERAIKRYTGSWRRMEELKTGIWSDYAHHPTEIKATLAAFREKFPRRKIVCVFQPHQADRLTRLFNDFVRAFDLADKVIFIPTYRVSGRERGMTRDAFDLAREVRRRKDDAFYAEDVRRAMRLLEKDFAAKSIVVFMGAGDIDAEARRCLQASNF